MSLLILFLLGRRSAEKPKALSFWIGPGWNLAGSFFTKIRIDWRSRIFDMTPYVQDGGHGVISGRWVLSSGECTHSVYPVAVWHFAIVPGRRLPSCRRCSWAATAFHSEPNMRRDADIQHLWWQSVRSCRPWTMEPSSPKDADLSYSEFRQSLKTFLFGQWCHSAVWTVLTAPSKNIRTYLLTYLLSYLLTQRLYSSAASSWSIVRSYLFHAILAWRGDACWWSDWSNPTRARLCR